MGSMKGLRNEAPSLKTRLRARLRALAPADGPATGLYGMAYWAWSGSWGYPSVAISKANVFTRTGGHYVSVPEPLTRTLQVVYAQITGGLL